MQKNNRVIFSVYCFLAALESVFVMFALGSLPSDPKHAWLFGLSPSRMASIAIVLFLGLSFYYAGWHGLRNASWVKHLAEWIDAVIQKGQNLFLVICLSSLNTAVWGEIYLITLGGWFGEFQAVMERIAPFLLWISPPPLNRAAFPAPMLC
jgi:hypothetical protein